MSQPTSQPASPSKSPTPGACGGCCCCSVGDDPEPDDPPWPPRPSPSASCDRDGASEDAVAATTTLAPLLRPNDCAATAPPSSSPPQESAAPLNVVAAGQKRFEVGRRAPDQPPWQTLSPRVTTVLGQNPSLYTLNGTNCYLVGTGQRRLLVDTGEADFGHAAFMESLDQCLDAIGVEGLSGIVITHLHHDHVGGVPGLLARYGVDLPVYKSEVPIELFATVTAIEARGLMEHFVTTDGEHAQFNPKTEVWVEGYEETLPLDLDVSNWAPGIDSLEELRRYFYFSYSARQFCDRLQVTREMNWQPLEDGTVVRTDGATLRCLHTPGHAVDHSSFLLMEEHAVLSGDTVLGFGTTVVHDMYDYMATLRRLLDARPMRLYPGHGPVIENGSDFIGRYIQHREARELQVWDALVELCVAAGDSAEEWLPVQATDIVSKLYTNTPPERLWMAEANVEKILLKFDQDGSTACFPQPQTQAPSHSTALVERDHSDDDTALIIRRERRTLATATTATQSYTLVGGSLGLEGLARYMPHSSARGVSWAPRYLLAAPGAKL